MKHSKILPKLIRLNEMPIDVGMDKNRFNKEARPMVTVMKANKQPIGFGRTDLGVWLKNIRHTMDILQSSI